MGLARGLTPSEKRPGILPDLQSMDTPRLCLRQHACHSGQGVRVKPSVRFVLPGFVPALPYPPSSTSFFPPLVFCLLFSSRVRKCVCKCARTHAQAHTHGYAHRSQDSHTSGHSQALARRTIWEVGSARLIELRGWVWQDIVYPSCSFLHEAGGSHSSSLCMHALQPPTSRVKDHAEGQRDAGHPLFVACLLSPHYLPRFS